jgi:hypothetical protein
MLPVPLLQDLTDLPLLLVVREIRGVKCVILPGGRHFRNGLQLLDELLIYARVLLEDFRDDRQGLVEDGPLVEPFQLCLRDEAARTVQPNPSAQRRPSPTLSALMHLCALHISLLDDP